MDIISKIPFKFAFSSKNLDSKYGMHVFVRHKDISREFNLLKGETLKIYKRKMHFKKCPKHARITSSSNKMSKISSCRIISKYYYACTRWMLVLPCDCTNWYLFATEFLHIHKCSVQNHFTNRPCDIWIE